MGGMRAGPQRPRLAEHERRFELFGSRVRLLIGEPLHPGLPSPQAMGLQLEGFLGVLHRKLTRFEPDSELSALNRDPHEACAVSPTLAVAVGAAVWAAQSSGGLVDSTLVPELERAGYATSRANVASERIGDALLVAPDRRPARPRTGSSWDSIEVNQDNGLVRRPVGVRIDTGGTGKGLAADLAADRLAGYATFVVDAGGDLRIGGDRPLERLVRIDHPLGDRPAHEFMLDGGAVATSGIKTRLWRTADGFAHHLLDPSTGQPAWTGVIQATALGQTALEAETLAKLAFLSGPRAAAEILGEAGGLIVLDDGSVELFGPLAPGRRSPAVMAA
jgi:FAD:protein FMN transferase